MSAIIQQRIAKINSSPLLAVYGKVLPMAKTTEARAAAAARLKRLMGDDSQEVIGKRTGVSQRWVGYLLDPNGPSPKLDKVEQVARYFGLETWEFLKPDDVKSDTATRKRHGIDSRLTSTQKQVMRYLEEPSLAEALLRFLEVAGQKGVRPANVRLTEFHGKRHSLPAARKQPQGRKGPPYTDS